ncbi:MAG: DNA-processing protein DprA [Thermoflavifilum sp.]|nr:DNA-processing protein DprA [Thermoflavifilum sp.]
MNHLIYQLALTRIPFIGPTLARQLIQHFHGDVEAIFTASQSKIERIPGIGPFRAKAIRDFRDFTELEKEICLLEKLNIRTCFITEPQYPQWLKECPDAPILLFYKGNLPKNGQRILSIVGTRKPTAYGREMCEQIIEALQKYQPWIVSGLAYGIDIAAHRAALKYNLPTTAVLAHGLDQIYPPQHTETAKQMLATGGWLSEFAPGVKPEKEHFPRRNRIIAGLSEATLIIETDLSGGSMITAHLAAGYHRTVMALPGRTIDVHSRGCLALIRNQIAVLVSSAEDIALELGWKDPRQQMNTMPRSLFREWNPAEQAIVDLFGTKNLRHVEEIYQLCGLPTTEAAAVLLQLELEGYVRSLPGKMYEWTG